MPADQKGRGEQDAAHSSLPRGRGQQLSLLINHFAIQARQQRLKFFSLTLASFNEPRYRKVALEQDCTWAISTHIPILNGFSGTTHTELDT